MQVRPITIANRPARVPLVCAPLVGRTREKLLAEVAVVAAKQPDLLEWRVDFFNGIGDTPQVLHVLAELKQAAGGIPILFTRRCRREGGEQISLSESKVVELYRAVCASRCVELVDFEMDNDAAHVSAVREMSRAAGVQLVLSFHDFQSTPSVDELEQRFEQAQSLGADVAKIAVMPRSMFDVLTLLDATAQASEKLSIPVVSMAMGARGAVTRACGWAFGSAMTFAVGEGASAPGQLPIEDVRAVVEILRKAR
jgi:3-dehydroquinate dehydratase I